MQLALKMASKLSQVGTFSVDFDSVFIIWCWFHARDVSYNNVGSSLVKTTSNELQLFYFEKKTGFLPNPTDLR